MIDAAIKERPILFNGEMVRAILEGRKTQTRRVVKFKFLPLEPEHHNVWKSPAGWQDGDDLITCPYGQPGDRLWVRETFAIEDASEYGLEAADPPEGPVRIEDGGPEWGEIPLIPRYRATQPDTLLGDDTDERGNPVMRWKPSIHMPRWASRITLEITDVRVERLRDTTHEEAKSEGIFETALHTKPTKTSVWSWEQYPTPNIFDTPLNAFRGLWDSINAKRGYGWEKNPWVWVVQFKHLQDLGD